MPVRKRRRFFAPVETSIVLRAVGIVLIVSTHVGLFRWQGAAHVLMAVAGYNFARFQLSGKRMPRLRRQLASVARIVVPSMAFIAVAYLITDNYAPANIVLLNAVLGPEGVTTQWHFWFIEILVYLLLAATALLAIPWADRAERRFPLLFPLALTGAGLLTRYELVDPGVPHTAPALWLFALGWAIARSRTVAQRCLVSVIAVLTVPGFFENPGREATLLAGILLLIWLPSIPVPQVLRRLMVVLASASLYAYLGPLGGLSAAGRDQPRLGRGRLAGRGGSLLGAVHARNECGQPVECRLTALKNDHADGAVIGPRVQPVDRGRRHPRQVRRSAPSTTWPPLGPSEYVTVIPAAVCRGGEVAYRVSGIYRDDAMASGSRPELDAAETQSVSAFRGFSLGIWERR